MRVKNMTIIMGVVGMVLSTRAQDYTASEPAPTTQPHYYQDAGDPLYHACELSLDAYGVGALHEYDFNDGGLHRKNYRFGGGVGANFFFTRYLGVGGDAFAIATHNNGNSFLDTTTGNLILRMPIGNTGLAPYIFGGAGYQFEGIDQVVGGGGVGLEFRIVPHFSIFADARYLVPVKTPDYGLARAGIRLSF